MFDTSGIFELLADTHRRRLLFLLYETDSVRVPEGLAMRGGAASAAPASENGASPDNRSADGATDLEVALYHNHLPQLEAAGLVRWDADEGVVRRGPAYEEIVPVLVAIMENIDAFPDDVL